MQILIGMIWPFKLLGFDEIPMYCLIIGNDNHATKEVIEINIMGNKKSNNLHVHI